MYQINRDLVQCCDLVLWFNTGRVSIGLWVLVLASIMEVAPALTTNVAMDSNRSSGTLIPVGLIINSLNFVLHRGHMLYLHHLSHSVAPTRGSSAATPPYQLVFAQAPSFNSEQTRGVFRHSPWIYNSFCPKHDVD